MDLFDTIKKGDKIVFELTAEEDSSLGWVTVSSPKSATSLYKDGWIGNSIVKVIPRSIAVGDIVTSSWPYTEEYEVLMIDADLAWVKVRQGRDHYTIDTFYLTRVP